MLARLFALACAVGTAWIALMFARQLIEILQKRSLRTIVPREPRLIYAQKLLFFGVAAPLTALAAIELLFYAVTGQVAGMINIGGRPLGAR